jgi:hypothetical protein
LDGSDKKNFLAAGDSTEILYWWHVLEEEHMLQYTLGILPDFVAGTSSVSPSVLSMTGNPDSKKKKERREEEHHSLLMANMENMKTLGDSLFSLAESEKKR